MDPKKEKKEEKLQPDKEWKPRGRGEGGLGGNQIWNQQFPRVVTGSSGRCIDRLKTEEKREARARSEARIKPAPPARRTMGPFLRMRCVAASCAIPIDCTLPNPLTWPSHARVCPSLLLALQRQDEILFAREGDRLNPPSARLAGSDIDLGTQAGGMMKKKKQTCAEKVAACGLLRPSSEGSD